MQVQKSSENRKQQEIKTIKQDDRKPNKSAITEIQWVKSQPE